MFPWPKATTITINHQRRKWQYQPTNEWPEGRRDESEPCCWWRCPPSSLRINQLLRRVRAIVLHTMLLVPMEYKRTSVFFSVVSLLILFYIANGERYYIIKSYLKVDWHAHKSKTSYLFVTFTFWTTGCRTTTFKIQ